MAKKKLTRKELSDLRTVYIEQRQALLQDKVDTLAITLYEQIFTDYLSQLEQVGGNLVLNNANISMVAGLDAIYKNFRDKYNIPVVKEYVKDIQGIPPLNQRYFNGISTKPTKIALSKAIDATNRGLGVTEKGAVIKNGFVDKFIRDTTLLQKIKKDTVQALAQGKGFQQFRQEMKQTIAGEAGKPLSGGLQQYYRNNVYDTYQKVDRIASDTFAEELGINYFIWTGGKLPTSRELCLYANGKIVDADKFKKLTYSQLKVKYRNGLPHGKSGTWDPLRDLGGFGCIHRKDYIATEVALRMKDKWLNVDSLKG